MAGFCSVRVGAGAASRWCACIMLGALAGVVGGVSGCQTTQPTGQAAHGQSPVRVEQLWGVWSFDRFAGQAPGTPAQLLRRPQLEFSPDGRVSGSGGVNTIGAQVPVELLADGRIDLSRMFSTKMAGPPEANQFEQRFLDTVGRATTWRVEGETLTLAGPAGELVRLRRAR